MAQSDRPEESAPINWSDVFPNAPWLKPFRGREALDLIRECLRRGLCTIHPHCKEEMRHDNLDLEDIEYVCLKGSLAAPKAHESNPRWNRESRPKEWSYLLEANVDNRKMRVAVRIRDCEGEPFVLAYTCWVVERG